jgi:biotin synthesis protein BioG
MKVLWHKKEGNRQLLLLFNGWGFDGKVFGEIDFPDCDMVSVYDYADIAPEQFDFTKLYPEVWIAAWSYGVFVAGFFSEYIFNVKKTMAINGSATPVDDDKGIPVNIFLATMQSFNAANRDKFYLRMAGGLSAYKCIADKLPDRDVENQLAELKSLYNLSLEKKMPNMDWDIVVISTHDRIFPLVNMKNAWDNKAIFLDGEHFPDFKDLLEKFMKDESENIRI